MTLIGPLFNIIASVFPKISDYLFNQSGPYIQGIKSKCIKHGGTLLAISVVFICFWSFFIQPTVFFFSNKTARGASHTQQTNKSIDFSSVWSQKPSLFL